MENKNSIIAGGDMTNVINEVNSGISLKKGNDSIHKKDTSYEFSIKEIEKKSAFISFIVGIITSLIASFLFHWIVN